jgi:hypothetical protein
LSRRPPLLLAAIVLATLLAGAQPAAAQVSVGDVTASEGDGAMTFTVERSLGDILELAPLTARTAPGTASPASDYTHVERGLSVLPGDREQVTVALVDDQVTEATETFRLEVVRNGSVVAEATGTIVDGDPMRVTAHGTTVRESAGVAEIVLTTSAADRPVPIAWRTEPETAQPGADYDPSGGTVVLPAGATRATFQVPIVDDEIDEPDETFAVLTTPGAGSPYGFGESRARVTILDDDLSTVSIGDAGAVEGDEGIGAARLAITLDRPTFRTVRLSYTTLDGTAVAPRDYLARMDQVTIPPGQTSAFVDVGIVGNTIPDPPRSFAVAVGQVDGALRGKTVGVVTITDDDAGRPPSGDVTPPNMRVETLRRSGRRVTSRITCPRNKTRCRGRMTLYSEPERGSRARAIRIERRLGRATYTLRGGQSRTLRVTVPRTIHAAAMSHGRLRVTAYVLTDDASGNTDTRLRRATLRFRR